MADPQKTMALELPPGMTPEQAGKMLQAAQKAADYSKNYDKCWRKAVTRLQELHPADWKKVYNEERKKVGMKAVS